MFFEYYGHEMLVEETEQLLQSGQTDVIEGFQSKDGERTFSARLILGKHTGWRVRPLFDYQLCYRNINASCENPAPAPHRKNNRAAKKSGAAFSHSVHFRPTQTFVSMAVFLRPDLA
jgi:hypothetical protein